MEEIVGESGSELSEDVVGDMDPLLEGRIASPTEAFKALCIGNLPICVPYRNARRLGIWSSRRLRARSALPRLDDAARGLIALPADAEEVQPLELPGIRPMQRE
jgi:hypothetical protein